jgi:hypothetical protein
MLRFGVPKLVFGGPGGFGAGHAEPEPAYRPFAEVYPEYVEVEAQELHRVELIVPETTEFCGCTLSAASA